MFSVRQKREIAEKVQANGAVAAPSVNPWNEAQATAPRTILKNKARCRTCKAVLISLHRHDLVACRCGNFVDGGHEYLRRGGKPEDLEELSTWA